MHKSAKNLTKSSANRFKTALDCHRMTHFGRILGAWRVTNLTSAP